MHLIGMGHTIQVFYNKHISYQKLTIKQCTNIQSNTLMENVNYDSVTTIAMNTGYYGAKTYLHKPNVKIIHIYPTFVPM